MFKRNIFTSIKYFIKDNFNFRCESVAEGGDMKYLTVHIFKEPRI